MAESMGGGRQRWAMGRITLTLGSILWMSVQCGVAIGEEPLYRFDTCEDLESYLHEQVLHPRQEIGSPNGSIGVFGCSGAALPAPNVGSPSEGEGEGERSESGSVAADSDSVFPGAVNGEQTAAGQGPIRPDNDPDREFSETNTQEEEVDEADFVKNDGDFLYMLRRGELIIVDAWPPEDAQVLSRTTLGGMGFTMFFDGDRALVASRTNSTVRSEFGGGLVFELYDLFDRANPRLLREVQVDGQWVDARRVGDEMLLITRSQMSWPRWQLNESEPFTDDANRALLEEHGFERALPGLRDRYVGTDAVLREGLAFQCENTWAPAASDGENLVVVHTLSLQDERAPMKSTAVVGNPDTIYASAKSIYLADTVWSDGGHFTPHLAETRIHKLRAFEGAGAADFVATGMVRGVLHNQFSMDEEDDRLRLVVSTNDDINRDVTALRSSLIVLEHDGVSLREVGRADNIGDGEFVQAVRFLGDRAYVVTFPIEGVDLNNPPVGLGVPDFRIGPPLNDPLFVIDLADPTNPRVRGELEVSGYSTYIHPLDRDHILTIGVETEGGAAPTAMQLQIFDVEDLDAPTLAHKETFGDGMAFSEALTDHHAFTYFPATQALSIPLQLADADGNVTSTGLALLRVDVEDGFTNLGTVEQIDMYGERGLDPWEGGCAAVRRSVQIKTENAAYVYAVSTAGVTVSSIEAGVPEVARIPLLEEGEGVCPPGTPL